MFLFFPFFVFLLRRSVGSRFLGAPSIESLVCPSSTGQPAWSRARTASRGQSKGRTGLLAFPERAHWLTFYPESFSASLLLFPFLALNSLHRKRQRLAWIFSSVDQGMIQILLDEEDTAFLSDEVCGGYCALRSSYSRSQSPALRMQAEDRLLTHCWNLLLRCSWLCRSHLCTLLSPPLDYNGPNRRNSLVYLWIPTVTFLALFECINGWVGEGMSEWTKRKHHQKKKKKKEKVRLFLS